MPDFLKIVSIIFAVIILVSLAGGCNFPTPAPTVPPDLVRTAAAQTVEAFSTQRALTPTATQAAGGTTPTNQATLPATPTGMPAQFTPTAQGLCDKVTFVEDVTIPDGTTLPPGTVFTKTWRIKNSGTCTWNAGYAIVFANEGVAMTNSPVFPLTAAPVAPEQVVSISVTLAAPTVAGTYKGYWKLRNQSGQMFGYGANAEKAFWVEIKVANRFSFADNLCSAEWTSTQGKIPCPNKDNLAKGGVYVVKDPVFENKYQDDEPALVMVPPAESNGQLIGKFPPIQVPANARFRTIVGCLEDATDCNVRLQLLATPTDTNLTQTLGEWTETYDEKIQRVDLDLNSLAGKTVSFSLLARSIGNPKRNWAFWLEPVIE